MSKLLRSWGQYPHHPQHGTSVHWREQLAETIAATADRAGGTLPFGNGRRYGDSCLASSDEVIALRSLNRVIEADWQNGIVTAEAGVTLAELLALCLPRGWFPGVTPGTRFVTLGGAIAKDVHGVAFGQFGSCRDGLRGGGIDHVLCR